MRAGILIATLLGLLAPAAVAAERLDWETGAGRSYVIPAAEIGGFVFGLNRFDYHVLEDPETYDVDADSIWRNLRTAPHLDDDPFRVNQLGHPYQGSIYYGAARSTGLGYWQSLLYTIGGSFLWETAGETTRPSINDHIASGIAGTFVGEALFRMSSLLLEGGGQTPGVWRELGAALISPPTGFNRLVFGERFRAVFPSRDPAVFVRVRLGATVATEVRNAPPSSDVNRADGMVDFSMAYGLPGKPGYRYTRPFDYFVFELTAVPSATEGANALENASVRGLLAGAAYDLGEESRGLWGVFGGYHYLSPQVFRLATTSVALGTVGQVWLSPTVALQGTVLAGVGFGAAGTAGDREQRDYHWGIIPEATLSLRLIVGDRMMLEASGRQYHVLGIDAGPAADVDPHARELIHRASLGATVRVHGPHALSVHYVVSSREVTGRSGRDQSVAAVGLAYTFLGQTRFGAVEWRADAVTR